jgi:hypothetical protein
VSFEILRERDQRGHSRSRSLMAVAIEVLD